MIIALMAKPPKRARTDAGGSYQDLVPLPQDFFQIHAREGKLLNVGNELRTARPDRHAQDGMDFWSLVTNWAPFDDPEFALFPDSTEYDRAIEAEVMEELEPEVRPCKKQKSCVSRRPHVVWKELHHQNYLDEVIRWDGRGDFFGSRECPDCLARGASQPQPAEYRCEECLTPDLDYVAHLKLLKRAGRGHDPAGVAATAPGELAVRCPSCPYPDINLPPNWRDAPAPFQYLYMAFTCMDANFRLKNQLVSNWSQDPGLGIGWAYMVPRGPYETYVLSQTDDEDISTCVGFQALAQANTKSTKGLRYTGVSGAFCGRSEMVLPMALGSLQKGERYSNMDYVFGSAIRDFLCLSTILISYDIACQWFVNLAKRMGESWPASLRLPATVKLIPAIPKLHEPMHEAANHQTFSLNFIRGVGKSDLETPERVWASHNALGNSTKTQGPGSRSDTIDDHIAAWNWTKYVGLGPYLARKYVDGLAERNIQREGHRGFTEALAPEGVEKWEAMCVAWESDEFPKKKANPYHVEGAALTESQVRKELAEEEQRCLAAGGTFLHTTSAASFVSLALEIEETQRRVRRLAKKSTSQDTARQEGGLIEQRNQLRTRIQAWQQLSPIYMPGLLQYKADLPPENRIDDPENSEDIRLWLPSEIAPSARDRVCSPGLAGIEERLRTAQCFDALDGVRTILTIKSRMVTFKNKKFIDRIHERARAAAEKYRAARAAKMTLSGPGDWEGLLQELLDGDIRGYQDPDRLRQDPPSTRNVGLHPVQRPPLTPRWHRRDKANAVMDLEGSTVFCEFIERQQRE
ncbi:hypothetical protein NLJ89_g11151 [Agrocybe chaxingu]|uniref:CxC2-like cysteine cluster KDZ transposase-associated domain-containing protein n=1 Tax=Agrocybe chaxingu TaxID=84603 RepID=A0A9W8JPW7_9AGAR|nr:hypothetical protein NLJ89_g11151 [Agrocybe chaxingu]